MSTPAADSSTCLSMGQQRETGVPKRKREVGSELGGFDVWSSIHELKKTAAAAASTPYVHPHLRHSSSSLSQTSLETCTERLGSETGSDDFSVDVEDLLSAPADGADENSVEGMISADDDDGQMLSERKLQELAAVNYHCSAKWSSPPRFFPPPLPSISRRDGPCVQMRHQRKDGRLVVQAVPAPSQNYLHCQRGGGRLHLSFVETTFEKIYHGSEESDATVERPVFALGNETEQEEEDEEAEYGLHDEYDEEEVEEVEVVDRGNVVEVKVRSTLPQMKSGGMKKHKSSLFINKFVGGAPLDERIEDKPATESSASETPDKTHEIVQLPVPPAAAPEVPATGIQEIVESWGSGQPSSTGTSQENKLLFTSKKMLNRQALLHQVRRCGEYNRPLFFFEPWCIATS